MTEVDKLRFFDNDAPAGDAIDGLLNRLTGDDSKTQTGCRVLRNCGRVAAVFPSVPFYPERSPEKCKLDQDWEKKSLLMHSQQEPLPTPPDKPSEIWGGITIDRGD